MGIGIGNGDNRAVDAATNAINNPLLEDARIEGASGILVNVSGGEDLSLSEYEEVVKIITANADDDALIIPGSSLDPSMEDEIKVTVIATGFNSAVSSSSTQKKKSDENEMVSVSEWSRMREGVHRESPNAF
jgi:cell division protein FtsZ